MRLLSFLYSWRARKQLNDAAKELARFGEVPQPSPAPSSSPSNRQAKLLTLAALSAIAGSASAANVNGELKRQQNNSKKLLEIHAPARPKFAAVIRDLEANEQKPYIVGAFRHPSTQAAIKAKGNSWVSWSLHNAMTKAGHPDALAFDLVDNRYFWQTGNDFWLMEASSAQSHDLHTGIRWGLKTADRQKIDALIKARNWKAKYLRGDDPGHAEVTGVTYGQAKAGQRPQYSK